MFTEKNTTAVVPASNASVIVAALSWRVDHTCFSMLFTSRKWLRGFAKK